MLLHNKLCNYVIYTKPSYFEGFFNDHSPVISFSLICSPMLVAVLCLNPAKVFEGRIVALGLYVLLHIAIAPLTKDFFLLLIL